ncbi:MAG: hypothetical protein ABSF09_13150 [Candidatus Bathyarchaeia archaeon]
MAESYFNELNRLKETATNLIGTMKNSEALLENLVKSACEEIKRVYVEEAKNRIDRIAEQKLDEIESEQSSLGGWVVKQAFGVLGVGLASKAEESESARKLSKAALEGYDMDEASRRKVGIASKTLKQRVEDQIMSMNGEEFMKSLKGGRALDKSLNRQFKEELERLGVAE